MKRYVLLILMVACLLTAGASASKNITFSTDHSDYYFNLGADATVPVSTENPFGISVSGMLTYKLTQQINQNGYYMSSTRANSASTSIEPGSNKMALDFGSSNSPGTVSVDLQFDYNVNGSKTVYLNGITVHYVSNSSQQSSGQQVSSSSQQNSQQNGQQQNQQQQNGQQQNQQQQNGQQQSQQQKQNNQIYNKLQQNQMAQDSSALKQQMKQDINEQKQLEQSFKNNIQKSPEVSQAMQDLKKAGFNQTGSKLNPKTNSTGTFNMSYTAKNGTQRSLQGEMENGTITKLKTVSESNKKKEEKTNYFFISLIICLLVAIIILLYYLKRKKNPNNVAIEKTGKPEGPFDYVAESRHLLDAAKKLFADGAYKDAYSCANRSVRLYLSYKYGLDKEITNDSLIKYFKDGHKPVKDLKECFDLCSLVEFAKYRADKRDFDKIIKIAEKTINKGR